MQIIKHKLNFNYSMSFGWWIGKHVIRFSINAARLVLLPYSVLRQERRQNSGERVRQTTKTIIIFCHMHPSPWFVNHARAGAYFLLFLLNTHFSSNTDCLNIGLLLIHICTAWKCRILFSASVLSSEAKKCSA